MQGNSDAQSALDRMGRRLDELEKRTQQLEAINLERAEKERKREHALSDSERERIWQDQIQPRFSSLGRLLKE
jgi:hypothetical protein